MIGLLGAAAGLTGWRLVGGEGAGSSAAREPAQARLPANTVTETVTASVNPPPKRAPTAEKRTPAELNDAGYAHLQAGDAAGALPLLERAVAALKGSASLTEAYASYNLAWARLALGRCEGVVDLLHRSEAVQGERKEIDRLRKQAEKACRPGRGREHRD